MKTVPALDPGKICFGLNQETDRQSLAIFLQLCGKKDFAELFASRMDSPEIHSLADTVMDLIRKHLTEGEYHSVFLGDNRSHRHASANGEDGTS